MVFTFTSHLLLFCFLIITPSSLSQPNNNQFCEAGIGHAESACGTGTPSSSKLLIKGGTVVNAHHQHVVDVYIEDGIIVAVNPSINVGDEVKVIDATGKFVMPG